MISNEEQNVFYAIQDCFIRSQVCLLETKEKTTGRRALLMCAVDVAEDGIYELIPFAEMFTKDMTERFETPSELAQINKLNTN
jgi:hypothetical protein